MSDRQMVSARTVRRWYFRGKGYAQRTLAYRAWAKELLMCEMYGMEWDHRTSPSIWAAPNRPKVTIFDDDHDEQLRRFALECHRKFFPPREGSGDWFDRDAKRRWVAAKAAEFMERYPEVVR